MTDLGSTHLSNIYGQQDGDTLQNILNNVPNIVPHLLASVDRDNNNIPRPTRLPSIQEAESPQLEQPGTTAGRSSTSNGIAGLALTLKTVESAKKKNAANDVTTTESTKVCVERDADGGYLNRVALDACTPTDSVNDIAETLGGSESEENLKDAGLVVTLDGDRSPHPSLESAHNGQKSTDSERSRRLVRQQVTNIDEDDMTPNRK